MRSRDQFTAGGYGRLDLEADIQADARLSRVVTLALLGPVEIGHPQSDVEAIAEVSRLAADAAERVMSAFHSAPRRRRFPRPARGSGGARRPDIASRPADPCIDLCIPKSVKCDDL